MGSPRATSAAKVGPESTARRARGSAAATTSLISAPLPASIPLAQMITGSAAATCGASAPATARRCCAGTARSSASAAAASASDAVAANRRIERDARQEQRVGVVAVERLDHLRLARPEQDIAAGAAQGLGQRRAPRPAADDADSIDPARTHRRR